MTCCQVQVGAELTRGTSQAETQEEEHHLIPDLRQPMTQFTLYQVLILDIYLYCCQLDCYSIMFC